MKKHLPIFLYHGTGDEVIPYPLAMKTYEKLKASGFELMQFTSEQHLGHTVSPKETRMITEFLTQHMN